MQGFLELSPDEAAYVELKLALSKRLRQLRKDRQCTQVQLAAEIASSQSRVAKMEASDPAVSLDLLIKALLALGVTSREIGETIATANDAAA